MIARSRAPLSYPERGGERLAPDPLTLTGRRRHPELPPPLLPILPGGARGPASKAPDLLTDPAHVAAALDAPDPARFTRRPAPPKCPDMVRYSRPILAAAALAARVDAWLYGGAVARRVLESRST